jgi:hypothetical protein
MPFGLGPLAPQVDNASNMIRPMSGDKTNSDKKNQPARLRPRVPATRANTPLKKTHNTDHRKLSTIRCSVTNACPDIAIRKSSITPPPFSGSASLARLLRESLGLDFGGVIAITE